VVALLCSSSKRMEGRWAVAEGDESGGGVGGASGECGVGAMVVGLGGASGGEGGGVGRGSGGV
jgi:hypothetical protein